MSETEIMQDASFAGMPAAPSRKRRVRASKPTANWSLTAFGAPWSSPWPLLRDQLQELADAGVPVTFVDVDDDPGAAERHRIIVVPTILLKRDGNERRRITGAVSVQELRDIIGKK